MNRTVRKAAIVLSHLCLVLCILFLGFFLICSARANALQKAPDPQAKDLYLVQAMKEHDFSVLTVGKALSDSTNPAREFLFIAIDLLIPLLCIASGILLQLASVRPRRKHTQKQPVSSRTIRR